MSLTALRESLQTLKLSSSKLLLLLLLFSFSILLFSVMFTEFSKFIAGLQSIVVSGFIDVEVMSMGVHFYGFIRIVCLDS